MRPLTKNEKRLSFLIKLVMIGLLVFVFFSGKAQKVRADKNGYLYNVDTIPIKFNTTQLIYKDEMMVEHTVYITYKGRYFYWGRTKKGNAVKRYITIID